MKLSIDDETTKEMLTEIMVEIIKTRKDLFYDLILEALEEISLANAIKEGRQDDFVSEEKIFALLDSEN
ncbi:hypothetical protein [Planktothrix paucivesiculata]|jgi:esterase/lipase|uniref:Uncharacterized protein n=1 Tax=Planktothrix paucivesiculata PCC 9631 TaxID=671071 RepID=A0A7Z9BW41_9CYAN|nr:hypothetical protein [Planktothrix paucivesiculata]OIP67102.1 MAG: hypothetical protein AUK43_20490 [Oscillatoriales cyanobacterium CG2_30_40_61]VXD20173.1 conserved hypothetical protein [Planktothrix paucivesiculata PCC 9631]